MYALLGVIPFLLFPPMTALGWILWIWLFTPLLLLDYMHLWLPDRLLIISMIAAPFIAPMINDIDLISRLIGGITGFMSLQLVRSASKRFHQMDAMGAGDPKLLGALGLYFGWAALPYIILIASSLGLIIALAMSIRLGYLEKNQKFPFGTYMIIATPVSSLIGAYLY